MTNALLCMTLSTVLCCYVQLKKLRGEQQQHWCRMCDFEVALCFAVSMALAVGAAWSFHLWIRAR